LQLHTNRRNLGWLLAFLSNRCGAVAVTLDAQAGDRPQVPPDDVFSKHRAHILPFKPQQLSLSRLVDLVQEVHKRSPKYNKATANCVWFAVELLKALSSSLSEEGYAALKDFLGSSQTKSLYKPHWGIPCVASKH
jgi:hypothetical protein